MLLLLPDDLRRADAATLANIVSRRDFIITATAGDLSGYALAVALHADWLAVAPDTMLDFKGDRGERAAIWSGVVSRIGPATLRFFLTSEERLSAGAAIGAGIADAVVPAGRDPLEWIGEWLAGRSTAALDSAAALIRRRGGDALERAEFSRLFATGEPQEGLSAFLAKRKADFIREVTSLQRDSGREESEKR